MIKIACLSYNDSTLPDFSHKSIKVDYFNNIQKIITEKYDVIVIINDKNNVDLIKTLQTIKTSDHVNIYLIDYEFNNDTLKEAFNYNIKDYLAFPININYLILKIINDYQSKLSDLNYSFKDLYIDFYASSVYIDKEEIILTRIEYKILKLLVENVNRPVSKSDIFNKVWNCSTKDYRTLVAHIKSLRKKLKNYGKNIITIYTVGYGFFE